MCLPGQADAEVWAAPLCEALILPKMFSEPDTPASGFRFSGHGQNLGFREKLCLVHKNACLNFLEPILVCLRLQGPKASRTEWSLSLITLSPLKAAHQAVMEAINNSQPKSKPPKCDTVTVSDRSAYVCIVRRKRYNNSQLRRTLLRSWTSGIFPMKSIRLLVVSFSAPPRSKSACGFCCVPDLLLKCCRSVDPGPWWEKKLICTVSTAFFIRI